MEFHADLVRLFDEEMLKFLADLADRPEGLAPARIDMMGHTLRSRFEEDLGSLNELFLDAIRAGLAQVRILLLDPLSFGDQVREVLQGQYASGEILRRRIVDFGDPEEGDIRVSLAKIKDEWLPAGRDGLANQRRPGGPSPPAELLERFRRGVQRAQRRVGRRALNGVGEVIERHPAPGPAATDASPGRIRPSGGPSRGAPRSAVEVRVTRRVMYVSTLRLANRMVVTLYKKRGLATHSHGFTVEEGEAAFGSYDQEFEGIWFEAGRDAQVLRDLLGR